ncbi:MAG: HPr family phosphocarrier protein [Ruminococcaceae bacterium]|nr:HPr family phosphocarrier protein [Oscillospiraceae bacterium]
MYSRVTTVINETGLHARPASDFVKVAKEFASKITIRNIAGGETVNAKSIVSILTAGLSKGVEVELCAEGEDENAAVDALVALIESGINE